MLNSFLFIMFSSAFVFRDVLQHLPLSAPFLTSRGPKEFELQLRKAGKFQQAYPNTERASQLILLAPSFWNPLLYVRGSWIAGMAVHLASDILLKNVEQVSAQRKLWSRELAQFLQASCSAKRTAVPVVLLGAPTCTKQGCALLELCNVVADGPVVWWACCLYSGYIVSSMRNTYPKHPKTYIMNRYE